MKIVNESLLVLAVLLGLKFSVVSAFEGVDESPIPVGFLQELKTAGKVLHQADSASPQTAVKFAPQNNVARLSKRKAILLSMLLPGLGERSIGSYRTAKYFYGSESSLWLALILFHKRQEWKKEDYQVYAAAMAGVENKGKNGQFYSDVSNYSDVDEFNAAIRRSRQPRSVYDAADEFWSWSSEKERLKFKSLKLESDAAGQNVKRIIGGMIINRIFSVMNTVYRYNKLNPPVAVSLNIINYPGLSLAAKF
ncbi:MAG: hypothetical protein IIB41_01530 [Candidatus Marinimicrobia bacterium]|nr:hypothetical protein [Candidatus Neomarinimicrobiota bacterium]